jgi:hypothetical protein
MREKIGRIRLTAFGTRRDAKRCDDRWTGRRPEGYRGEIEREASKCWECGGLDRRGIIRVTGAQLR